MSREFARMRRAIAPSPAQPSGPAGGPITAQNTLGRPNYGPPSNLRQLFPEPTGRNLSDLFERKERRRGPWDQDFRWNRGPSTTVPEGFNDPDRFGRMRPTQANNPYAGRINNNPMGGANIGGGWNQYEGAPERGWDYFNMRNATPMSSGNTNEDKMAQMGGYGYNPDPNKSYDDIYKGTDIIDMEVLPGAGYGPDDEYDFDYKRDRFEDLLPGTWPQYAARGGLMSLRR